MGVAHRVIGRTQLNKSVQYVGKVLNKLFEANLAITRKYGKSKYYRPALNAVIASLKQKYFTNNPQATEKLPGTAILLLSID